MDPVRNILGQNGRVWVAEVYRDILTSRQIDITPQQFIMAQDMGSAGKWIGGSVFDADDIVYAFAPTKSAAENIAWKRWISQIKP